MENNNLNNQQNGKNNIIIVIVALTCLIIIGMVGYKLFIEKPKENVETNNSSEAKTNDKIINTFSKSTDSGIAVVKGYAYIEKMQHECYDDCDTAPYEDYVFFHVSETKSEDFKAYINGLNGNSFARENAIGLGCVKNNQLTYVNNSDAKEWQSLTLTTVDTNKILSSTASSSITLKLEKLALTNGGPAVDCYSHITNVTVLD